MTAKDTITLPREVAEAAVEALMVATTPIPADRHKVIGAIEALRTALAAEQPKPSDSLKAMKEAFRILTKPESGYLRWQVSDACDILRTAIRTAQSALAAEQPKTPAWCMDGLAATLMREGVNKHRAREIAVGYWEAYCQIPGNKEDET